MAKQFCKTYSAKHCNCANQCPEGTYFEIKCAGCGAWHWVDHEGYKVKRLNKAWVRTAKAVTACPMEDSLMMKPEHVSCRCTTLVPEMTDVSCETCEGTGTVDETLGGDCFANLMAVCPDCDGEGFVCTA